MHRFRSVVYLLIAVANVTATIPLVRAYGGIGAAIGTAASLLLGNGLVMNWYNHTQVGLDMGYFWKRILSFVPSLIPPVVVGTLVSLYADLDSVLRLLAFGCVYIAVFAASLWHLGMDPREKELFRSPIRRWLQAVTPGRGDR